MSSNKAGNNHIANLANNIADSSTITESQFGLIIGSCMYSLSAMTIAAVLVYVFLNAQFQGPALNIWMVFILLIDSICLYLIWKVSKRRMTERIYSQHGRQSILVFTILFGMAWGAAGLILLPLAEAHDQLVIFVILLGVVTGVAMTLAYRFIYAITFVLLVMLPLMTGIFISEEIAGVSAILLNILMSIYLLFLLKNILLLYDNTNRLLYQQALSTDRELALSIQCEQAIQASQSKSVFLANMSHELRTPMHAILGFSDLGTSKVASQTPEKLASYFSRIHESGQRMLGLLDDVLELSKLETDRVCLDLSEQDINSTVNFVVDKLRHLLEEHSLTVDVTSTTENTIASFDYDKLIQVLQHLLKNAIRFSPANSTITICLEDAYLSSTENQAETAGSPAISITVKDQGAGMTQTELETVFEKPAHPGKKGKITNGSGLGLAICKQIIKQHGGEIQARNNNTGGSAFTLTIPRSGPLISDQHPD